jgi:hypothetical protein
MQRYSGYWQWYMLAKNFNCTPETIEDMKAEQAAIWLGLSKYEGHMDKKYMEWLKNHGR